MNDLKCVSAAAELEGFKAMLQDLMGKLVGTTSKSNSQLQFLGVSKPRHHPHSYFRYPSEWNTICPLSGLGVYSIIKSDLKNVSIQKLWFTNIQHFSNPKPLKITKMLLRYMTQLWLSHHSVHLLFPICASSNNSASCPVSRQWHSAPFLPLGWVAKLYCQYQDAATENVVSILSTFVC